MRHKVENDNVNHPSHYNQGGVECIDAIKAATCELQGIEAVCTGNAIKYMWRWKGKNGIQDLLKAKWYLNRLIAEASMEQVPEETRRCDDCKHVLIGGDEYPCTDCIGYKEKPYWTPKDEEATKCPKVTEGSTRNC